ncbi:dienelactone hydrolase family protein [Myxosarcina sp. GI1]|uniref:dienelactone hydrolase family protein n=1 Tax=Myxosarcina sp. GI1 TaxID=1541065 RepID=UPI00055F42FF|nr:dienelactone hydrolase family protein [Myxosarcina sp. GI1]
MKQQGSKKLGLVLAFIVTLVVSLVVSSIPSDAETSLAAVHQNDRPTPTAIARVEPKVAITAKEVDYATANGKTVTGYFVSPQDQAKPLPGIIAIHEWWGLNNNIKAMARRLAGEGYQVLAVDLYNGQTADSPDKASQLTETVSENPQVAKENLRLAYQYLVEQKQAPTMGSIGWCFGGSWSLQTALIYPEELDAAVIYYGGQIGEATEAELATLNVPILGIFGAEDSSIPVATVTEFESTLDELNVPSEFHIYENAGHAFANPSGNRYVAKAAEKAWQETTQFLAKYLS